MASRLGYALRSLAQAVEGPPPRLWLPPSAGYPSDMPASDSLHRSPNMGGGAKVGDLSYSDYQLDKTLGDGGGTSGGFAAGSYAKVFQLRNLPTTHDLDLSIRLGIQLTPALGPVVAYVGLADAMVAYGSAPGGPFLFFSPGSVGPPTMPQGIRVAHESYPPVQLASGSLAWTTIESSYLQAYKPSASAVWCWFSVMINGSTAGQTPPNVTSLQFFMEVTGRVSAGQTTPSMAMGGFGGPDKKPTGGQTGPPSTYPGGTDEDSVRGFIPGLDPSGHFPR